MEDTNTNNQEELDQSSAVDGKLNPEEDQNLPLHKDKRFQELREEVKESKALIEQQNAALNEMQKAVTQMASARTETERDTIVDKLVKDLDSKAGDLLPSDIIKGMREVLKAEADQAKETEAQVETQTAQETLQSFNEVQALEDLTNEEVEELGAWMLEQLNKSGDKRIYADPLRAFHQWDKVRQVELAAKKDAEDKKSRSGTGSSSAPAGEAVKITLAELMRMSPLDAKRRAIER